jgi:hypothetical protein
MTEQQTFVIPAGFPLFAIAGLVLSMVDDVTIAADADRDTIAEHLAQGGRSDLIQFLAYDSTDEQGNPIRVVYNSLGQKIIQTAEQIKAVEDHIADSAEVTTPEVVVVPDAPAEVVEAPVAEAEVPAGEVEAPAEAEAPAAEVVEEPTQPIDPSHQEAAEQVATDRAADLGMPNPAAIATTVEEAPAAEETVETPPIAEIPAEETEEAPVAEEAPAEAEAEEGKSESEESTPSTTEPASESSDSEPTSTESTSTTEGSSTSSETETVVEEAPVVAEEAPVVVAEEAAPVVVEEAPKAGSIDAVEAEAIKADIDKALQD